METIIRNLSSLVKSRSFCPCDTVRTVLDSVGYLPLNRGNVVYVDGNICGLDDTIASFGAKEDGRVSVAILESGSGWA